MKLAKCRSTDLNNKDKLTLWHRKQCDQLAPFHFFGTFASKFTRIDLLDWNCVCKVRNFLHNQIFSNALWPKLRMTVTYFLRGKQFCIAVTITFCYFAIGLRCDIIGDPFRLFYVFSILKSQCLFWSWISLIFFS